MADPRQPDVDRLIAGAYDAATQSALWEDWLASATRCFGGHSSLYFIQDPRQGATELLGAHNLSQDAIRLYGEYYHCRDLWTQRSSKIRMKAMLSADLCTDEEFANSEIYVDFSKRSADGQFYVVGATFALDDRLTGIGFQNTRRMGAFSRSHAQALDRLLPHLQRALTIRSRLKDSTSQNAAFQTTLDLLSHGVLLVALDGTLVYANRKAEEILKSADGLSVGTKGSLIAARQAKSDELRGLIARFSLATGGGAMVLPRPSGLRPLEVIVAPLTGNARAGLPHKATAVVFLRDPESQPQPVPAILASFYGLTPAEARLAADLLLHLTLDEIAARRRTSRETLRSQLKEIFRKTGTNRQSELIGFLTAGLATTVAKP